MYSMDDIKDMVIGEGVVRLIEEGWLDAPEIPDGALSKLWEELQEEHRAFQAKVRRFTEFVEEA